MEKEKYELVLEAIEAGGQTDDTLMELIGTKSVRGVKNQFKFINVLKKYPHFDDEKGEYVILNAEQYEAAQKKAGAAKEAEKKWTKDPQNKRITLESRLNTKTSRMNAAKRKLDADPDDVRTKLRHTMAVCDYNLAMLNLSDFQKDMCEELGMTMDQYLDCPDLDAAQEEAQANTGDTVDG